MKVTDKVQITIQGIKYKQSVERKSDEQKSKDAPAIVEVLRIDKVEKNKMELAVQGQDF